MNQRYQFKKTHRLLNANEFSRVFDSPTFKIHHPQFLILARSNDLKHPRLGLVIAKKHIRHAVDRGRCKRVIRESFRNKQHNLPAIDAIVLARRGSEALINENLREILDSLWARVAKKAAKTRENQ